MTASGIVEVIEITHEEHDVEKAAEHAGEGPAVFKFIQGRESAYLAWKDLSYSVKTKTGQKQILKGMSGDLEPGKLTCILGPSGSGKTTLLNLLSGRVGAGGRFSAQIAGEISLNAIPITPSNQQHVFGYVMQEDSLFATETPKEILTFSAKLRLHGVNKEEVESLTNDMIESLGLKECANTYAGNDMIKGISGGQKKRTSIGAELITNPAITFLDEPTSGLDTAAAYNVCNVLKQLANAGQSVMCTIHQPSSEIFQLFDSAIFLARGQVIYQGPPAGIRQYFDQLGCTCPLDYNPADFVMFLVEGADESKFEKLVTGFVPQLKDMSATTGLEIPPRTAGKGFCVELSTLVGRSLRSVGRDKPALGGRFGLSIFLNVIFSFIFWRVGDDDADHSMQSHMGALTMVGINSMFSCTQPTLLAFPSERPVFLREYASQMYGVVPYFLSKTVVEIVLLGLQCTIVWLIDYWMMGFRGNFLVHLGGSVLIGLSCSSLGLMLGCSISNVQTAVEVAPLALVPQILFAGFFIQMEQIPEALRWLQYLCSLKWGMNILLVNEFGDDEVGMKMLERNDVNKDDVGLYVGILCLLIVLFRFVGMLLLRSKGRTLYG
eukprot:TRINITY_DN2565_c0_g2_i2.p1 TRINITY_DN2565_c0_g2~~TRINITY_DN2565_c0_g2_i2.p1  ORF type:complete len:619 (-),score=111.21 TRINITY_DN2565_c0_g2_i2:13-1830(-)